jgi:hypothetical protein
MDEASLERRCAGRGDCGGGAGLGAGADDTRGAGCSAGRPGGEFACRTGGGATVVAGGVAAFCCRAECGPIGRRE